MGCHRAGALDHCVDYRRGHSRVQRLIVTHQRSVCELVYVWAERCILVIFELRAVPELEAEDVFDRGERGVFLSRGHHCEFHPLILLAYRGIPLALKHADGGLSVD